MAGAFGYDIQESKTTAAHSSATTTEYFLKTYREPLSRVEPVQNPFGPKVLTMSPV
jgi:hypothetical protein